MSRSALLHLTWRNLFNFETLAAISPSHFYSVLVLPSKKMLSLDGNPETIEILTTSKIQYKKNGFRWLIVGDHRDMYMGAIWLWMGVKYRENGEHGQSAYCYDQALSKIRNCPDVYINYGNLYCDMEKLFEAKRMYERALWLDPDHPTLAETINQINEELKT